MNKDRIKGAMDEVAGSVKRAVGKQTGNSRLQVKGMAQQGKGKLESAWGEAKDAAQGAGAATRVNTPRSKKRT